MDIRGEGAAFGACSRRAGCKSSYWAYVGLCPVRRVGAPPTPLRQWGSVPGVATPRRSIRNPPGPHFLRPGPDGPDRNAPVVMVESRAVFRRLRFHRAKAHLVLSAMRHRAAELGERVHYVRADTYQEGLHMAVGDKPVTVHHPTSRAALGFVMALDNVTVLPACGFLVAHDDFTAWAGERDGGRLLQEASTDGSAAGTSC
jgi:hypothetical protein